VRYIAIYYTMLYIALYVMLCWQPLYVANAGGVIAMRLTHSHEDGFLLYILSEVTSTLITLLPSEEMENFWEFNIN